MIDFTKYLSPTHLNGLSLILTQFLRKSKITFINKSRLTFFLQKFVLYCHYFFTRQNLYNRPKASLDPRPHFHHCFGGFFCTNSKGISLIALHLNLKTQLKSAVVFFLWLHVRVFCVSCVQSLVKNFMRDALVPKSDATHQPWLESKFQFILSLSETCKLQFHCRQLKKKCIFKTCRVWNLKLPLFS